MKPLLALLKKHHKPFLSLAIFCLLLGFLLSYAREPVSIQIHASYDEPSHSLLVRQRIHYPNQTGFTLDSIPLHVYPNAYFSQGTAPVLPSEMAQSYPQGFSPGYAHISAIQADGQPVPFFISGRQNTVCTLRLPEPLKNGQSVDLELEYSLHLPQTSLRFGYSDADVRLGNAFIVPAHFEDGAFSSGAYPPIGDPFVLDVADYKVTLDMPSHYVVAAPGLVSTDGSGTWEFQLNDAREFCAVFSADFCVSQQEKGGTRIRAFASDQALANDMAAHAALALDTFTQLFGPYPYPEYVVAETDFYIGGMEYPAMAMVDKRLVAPGEELLELVIAHETAHQWWYAQVGSDQLNHPWQDEGLAEYSTLLYYEKNHGQEAFHRLYNATVRPVLESGAWSAAPLSSPITAFETMAAYDAAVYKQGAAMWHSLRSAMGNDAFFSALQTYAKQNRFKVARPHDLLQAMGPTGGQRLLQWLGGELPASP